MQPDAVLAARDLGRIGAPADDCTDADGVAGGFGCGGDDDPITEPKMGVGGEASVY